ncbi:CBS domain-containing protein [Acuticoccus sediminis]|nr:CBS domain-containing protein [Acuticoccus sediminis]
MMQTKDIMTTPVVSVAPETGVSDVARLLLERHVSAVPVIDSAGRLVGMVSEGDFLRRAEDGSHRHGSWWLRLFAGSGENAADYVKTHGRSAADVMTRDVVTVTEDMPAGDVAHLLETKRIKRVPVLRNGKVVGIVSRADLLRGLAAQRHAPADTASIEDETIRKQILEEIRTADWAPTYGVSVVVVDGIVQFWGVVDSHEQGEALRVAAGNVPGVKGVELNVSSIPAYGMWT